MRSVLPRLALILPLLLLATSDGAEPNTGSSEPPVKRGAPRGEDFERVRRFCDLLLKHGRDEYGPKRLAIWANAYDIEKQSVPIPEKPYSRHMGGHAPYTCNLQQQASLLRLLWHMTDMTGDPKYRQGVVDCLRDYFEHVAHPQTGGFPWGTHCGYDVLEDKVFGRGQAGLAEEKLADFPWEIAYAVDPRATLKMIDHMRLSYNQEMTTYFHHRDLSRTEPRTPGPMFNIDDVTGNHPYTIAGVTHMKAWAFAHAQTGERKYRDWVEAVYRIHTDPLDEEVGLITEMPNLFRLRVWPASDNQWLRRSVMVKFGDPYLWGFYMHKVADRLGEEHGARYRASGADQLARWPRHMWDEEAKRFRANWPIYRPESPAAVEISEADKFTQRRLGEWYGVTKAQGHHQMVTAYRAYANAYLRTGNEEYRRVADRVREAHFDPAMHDDREQPGYALLLAIHLQATAELYDRSRDEQYRRQGERLVEKAYRDFVRDGFILGMPGTSLVSHTGGSDDLAVALLRWDCTLRGEKCPVEDSYLFDWGYSFP